MKRELILSIMCEKVEKKWDFDDIYKYLILLEDLEKFKNTKVTEITHVS